MKKRLEFLAICVVCLAGLIYAQSPVLETGIGAAPVSFSTAVLHGNVVSNGPANVKIYWGTNTNAWANTNNVGNVEQGDRFSVAVCELTPESAYYYQCTGSNANGTGLSGVASFTTTVSFAVFYGGWYDGYDTCRADGFPKGHGTIISIR